MNESELGAILKGHRLLTPRAQNIVGCIRKMSWIFNEVFSRIIDLTKDVSQLRHWNVVIQKQ